MMYHMQMWRQMRESMNLDVVRVGSIWMVRARIATVSSFIQRLCIKTLTSSLIYLEPLCLYRHLTYVHAVNK